MRGTAWRASLERGEGALGAKAPTPSLAALAAGVCGSGGLLRVVAASSFLLCVVTVLALPSALSCVLSNDLSICGLLRESSPGLIHFCCFLLNWAGARVLCSHGPRPRHGRRSPPWLCLCCGLGLVLPFSFRLFPSLTLDFLCASLFRLPAPRSGLRALTSRGALWARSVRPGYGRPVHDDHFQRPDLHPFSAATCHDPPRGTSP